MKLGARLEGKLDPRLLSALRTAAADGTVRVVANLRRSAPIGPADLAAVGGRAAARARRMDAIREAGAAVHGAFLDRARSLGLSVGGGELTGAVVVEGRAGAVGALLDCDDVTSAILDAPLTLIAPVGPAAGPTD